MTASLDPDGEEWRELEEPLLDFDSHLNIFALANGLDLLRNDRGVPGRTLEWFRDGMERWVRIEARPGESPRWCVSIGAARKQDGVRRETESRVYEADAFAELREGIQGLLEGLLDQANEIPESDLRPAD